MKYSILEIDQGFCRIVFIATEGRQAYYYCLQQDTDTTVQFYQCTDDGEPSHPVEFKDLAMWFNVELPSRNTKLEKLCHDYVLNKRTESVSRGTNKV